MGPRPQCNIPSHKVIDPLVLEKKIFEVFLPYMGVAAILVMCPRFCKQIFVPPSHWGSIWNLALTGPAVLEKKIFENGGRTTDGRMDDRPWLYYKLTNDPKGSGELKSIAVFSGKTDVPHLPNQSTVANSVMKLWPWKLGQDHPTLMSYGSCLIYIGLQTW